MANAPAIPDDHVVEAPVCFLKLFAPEGFLHKFYGNRNYQCNFDECMLPRAFVAGNYAKGNIPHGFNLYNVVGSVWNVSIVTKESGDAYLRDGCADSCAKHSTYRGSVNPQEPIDVYYDEKATSAIKTAENAFQDEGIIDLTGDDISTPYKYKDGKNEMFDEVSEANRTAKRKLPKIWQSVVIKSEKPDAV